MRVCADDVAPTKYVRDLGIYIDSDMSMKIHVSPMCFAALRHIRSIRRSVCQPVLLSLVTSLVLTRLDYGSVTLNGITKHLMDRLQSVLNAAARLIIIIIIIIIKTFITRKFAEAANARSVDSTEEKCLQSLFEDVQRDVR